MGAGASTTALPAQSEKQARELGYTQEKIDEFKKVHPELLPDYVDKATATKFAHASIDSIFAAKVLHARTCTVCTHV